MIKKSIATAGTVGAGLAAATGTASADPDYTITCYQDGSGSGSYEIEVTESGGSIQVAKDGSENDGNDQLIGISGGIVIDGSVDSSDQIDEWHITNGTYTVEDSNNVTIVDDQ